MPFYARHRQTHMFLADRERPLSEAHGAKSNGAAPNFKWVRTVEEAKSFKDPVEAFMGLQFVLKDNYEARGHVVDHDGNLVENYQKALDIKYPKGE